MNAYQRLLDNLDHLEAQKQTIQQQGSYYLNAWIENTPAGGTARGIGRTTRYYTLRSRTEVFSNGKKFVYIPLSQVNKYRLAVERGRQIKQLDRKIASLRQRLHKVERMLSTP